MLMVWTRKGLQALVRGLCFETIGGVVGLIGNLYCIYEIYKSKETEKSMLINMWNQYILYVWTRSFSA